MRQNLMRTGLRPPHLVSGIPAAFSWILFALLAAAGSVMVPSGKVPVTAVAGLPANVETRIVAQGLDAQQRSLPFTVYVLSQQLSWKLESADDLDGGRSILSPELIIVINQAREVFCVGTASSEGATRTEEGRAADRAAKLALWVGSVIAHPGSPHLFTLNAGQYQGPSVLLSEQQRKAIILVTGPHDDDVNLAEALGSGLEQQQRESPVIYALLHHYSRSQTWLKDHLGQTITKLDTLPKVPF